MIISVSNTVTHKASLEKAIRNQKDLQKTVMDNLQKLGLSPEDLKWNEYGHLELSSNYDGLKLHNLMLQMESLGLELKMTKKTLIEIC